MGGDFYDVAKKPSGVEVKDGQIVSATKGGIIVTDTKLHWPASDTKEMVWPGANETDPFKWNNRLTLLKKKLDVNKSPIVCVRELPKWAFAEFSDHLKSIGYHVHSGEISPKNPNSLMMMTAIRGDIRPGINVVVSANPGPDEALQKKEGSTKDTDWGCLSCSHGIKMPWGLPKKEEEMTNSTKEVEKPATDEEPKKDVPEAEVKKPITEEPEKKDAEDPEDTKPVTRAMLQDASTTFMITRDVGGLFTVFHLYANAPRKMRIRIANSLRKVASLWMTIGVYPILSGDSYVEEEKMDFHTKGLFPGVSVSVDRPAHSDYSASDDMVAKIAKTIARGNAYKKIMGIRAKMEKSNGDMDFLTHEGMMHDMLGAADELDKASGESGKDS